MAGDPHPADSLLIDGVDVSKSDFRSFIRNNSILVLSDEDEVQNTNLSGQQIIQLKSTGRDYKLDTSDTTSAHDGELVLVDANGLRFHLHQHEGVDGADGTGMFSRVRVVDATGLTPLNDYQSGDTVDGVVLAANDLVLRAAQSSSPDKNRELNGVYVVPALTSPATAPARDTSFNTYDEHPGCYFSVMEGTTYADTLWQCTSNKGGVLNSTAIVIEQKVIATSSFATDVEAAAAVSTTKVLNPKNLAIAEVDVAISGATADIGAAASNNIRITGNSSPITSFGTAPAGIRRVCRMAGASPSVEITHSANIILPNNGLSITTAANDRFEALSLGAGVWIVLWFMPAAGQAFVGSNPVIISSGSLGTAAVLDVPNIPQYFAHLEVSISGASSDTATREPLIQVSTDNGANFEAVAATYTGHRLTVGAATVAANTKASILQAATATAAQTFAGTAFIFGYNSGAPKRVSGAMGITGVSEFNNTSSIQIFAAINAIRFLWDGSGNFDAGTYAIRGYR